MSAPAGAGAGPAAGSGDDGASPSAAPAAAAAAGGGAAAAGTGAGAPAAGAPAAGAPAAGGAGPPPVAVLMVGMAGSGKTTLVQRVQAELRVRGGSPYVVNLDPAVAHVPYGPSIDIRDTVNYKEVMKQYGLGPNGGCHRVMLQ
jgi:GPN-loop GTPase